MTERYRKIGENLAVYLPNQRSKTYWCRYRHDGEEVKISTKKRTIEEATEVAFGIKYEVSKRAIEGLPLKATNTLNTYKDEFITYLEKSEKTTLRTYKRILNNFILPYMGKMQITDIKPKHIEAMHKKYKIKSKTQQNVTKTTFKRLFDFAEINELIKPSARPMYPDFEAKEKESFDLFSPNEFQAIFDYLDEFKNTGRTAKSKEKRNIFYYYIFLLSMTGARPGVELLKAEMQDLTVTNSPHGTPFFKFDEVFLKIRFGKMSKKKGSRTIPLQMLASQYLAGFLFDNYGKWMPDNWDKSLIEYLSEFHPNKPIFSYKDSNTVPNFEHDFKDMVDELVLKNKLNETKKFAAYSFRHHYITSALIQGVDVMLLSTAVGNSPQEIHDTYSQLVATLRKDEIYAINFDFGDKKKDKKAVANNDFENILKGK